MAATFAQRHTLSLKVINAPVTFESSSRQGAIDQFKVWLQALRPEEWHVAAGGGPEASLYLRFESQAAVGGSVKGAWVVTSYGLPGRVDGPTAFKQPHLALAAFGELLRGNGDHWRRPRPSVGEAHPPIVTLILPDQEQVTTAIEPDPAQVSEAIGFLAGLLRAQKKLAWDLHVERQAVATALRFLSHNQIPQAREALAAIPAQPGEFDYAALPPAVQDALEDLSHGVVRADEAELRRLGHALLQAVGLGWTTGEIEAELAAMEAEKGDLANG